MNNSMDQNDMVAKTPKEKVNLSHSNFKASGLVGCALPKQVRCDLELELAGQGYAYVAVMSTELLNYLGQLLFT